VTDHQCPDCGVAMEPVDVTAGGTTGLFVGTERDAGVLGRLGVDEHTRLEGRLCPECGLTRLYADTEE
jgi:rubredoxin